MHQLSSTTWTVKYGLEVFKHLELQRQKGRLNNGVARPDTHLSSGGIADPSYYPGQELKNDFILEE